MWLLIATLALLLAIGLALSWLSLWVGSKIVRAGAGPRRLLATIAGLSAITVAFVVVVLWTGTGRNEGALGGIAALVSMVCSLLVIKAGLRVGWWRGVGATAIYLVLNAGLSYGLMYPCRSFLVEGLRITSASMEPTLAVGDCFVLDRTARPHRWDVVVIPMPWEPGTVFAKRLVGLPGETVEIADGEVMINGSKATRPRELGWIRYSSERPRGLKCRGGTGSPCTLGAGEIYVLGDNVGYSLDSRDWPEGSLRESDVRGVARLIYSPWSRVRGLDVVR